jgi:hypothetical protein
MDGEFVGYTLQVQVKEKAIALYIIFFEHKTDAQSGKKNTTLAFRVISKCVCT